MNQRSHVLCRSFLLISLLQCLSQNVFADELAKISTAQEAADKLGVGINLGNMLDAPNEGDWVFDLKTTMQRSFAKPDFNTSGCQ